MKRYDLSRLMHKAWSLFHRASKKSVASFSDCLRLAWRWLKCQAANRTKVEQAAAAAGYGDIVYHTWYGWKMAGRMVCHTETAAFQVLIEDPTVKKGSKLESYFTWEQTFEPLAI